MALISRRFAGVPELEACAVDDNAHLLEGASGPHVQLVQQALLDLGESLGDDGPTGYYGQLTAAAVTNYKAARGIVNADGLIDPIVGKKTIAALDAEIETLDVAHDPPIDPPPAGQATTITITNQFDEPLANLAFTATALAGETQLITDESGTAVVFAEGVVSVHLDPEGTIFTLGDLLQRPAHVEPPAGAVPGSVLNDGAPVALAGESLQVRVMSRVDLLVEQVMPLEGTVRIEGSGVRLGFDEVNVLAMLQANGGGEAFVFLDPPPPAVEVPPLPTEIPGWQLPNGYVVRDGDTEEDLSTRFLGEPSRFAELSDHPPVPFETIFLPDAALPGWLSLATEPLPPPAEPQLWFSVVPDDVIRALLFDGDPAPLEALLDALASPPPAGPDPAQDAVARASAVASLAVFGGPPAADDTPTQLDLGDGGFDGSDG
jgi:hypothetical protein